MSLFTGYILGITVIKVGKLWARQRPLARDPTEAKREQGVSIPLVSSVLRFNVVVKLSCLSLQRCQKMK
jgi:hypothetical protein